MLKKGRKILAFFLIACTLLAVGSVAGAKSYKKAKNKNGYLVASGYDYSLSVPKASPQGVGYLNDAAIFGDSRTEGLFLYTDIKNTRAQKYCDIGLNCQTVLTKKFKTVSGKDATALQHLKSKKKTINKVYFLFGLNELSWNKETFISNYKKLIKEVRKIVPNAIIYIQSIIPVTKSKSLTDSSHNNTKIKAFNEALGQLAEEQQIFFIDTSPYMTDAEGNLPEGISSDGIHFGATFSRNWLNFLLTRTVEVKK